MKSSSNKAASPSAYPAVRHALVQLRAYLAERGMRLTAQRRMVVEEVFRRPGHFDAEELYESFRAAGRHVSRATVYRALGHLRECGLVNELLQYRERARYEPVFGQDHHDHMLCVRCGKVIEFRNERIEELQRRICRTHGFKALEHRMGIRGICRECRRAKKGKGD